VNELHADARRELDDAVAYLEAERSGAGLRFLDHFLDAVHLLRAYPRAGRAVGRRLRKYAIPATTYSIIYTIEAFGIFVVALAHQSRKPNYWRNRLPE
jgi:plasmid stabilization system protein ParE